GQDEEFVVERDQVRPAIGFTRRVRNKLALLPEELEPRLEPAHRARRPFDEEGDVLERGLGGLGGVACGEADVGSAHKGSRHLDHELLKHSPKTSSALDYTVVIRFNGNSGRLLLLFRGSAAGHPRRPGY